jgi:tRNA threonylcarbamoyladenosine biosynthesis protein TsaE
VEERSPGFCFRSPEPERTRGVAAALASVLPETGLVLSLCGGLGAGKTLFVKGLAEGMGLAPESVTSPTFTIVNEYTRDAGVKLIHIDLYRLESEIELEEVGFFDLLELDAVLAIEWGDRFPKLLPRDRVEVVIERPADAGGQERLLEVGCAGPVSERVLRDWQMCIEAPA